jgi:DNA repair exonuclease SbcCD nuclease subunit
MTYPELQPGKLPKTPPKGCVRLVHTADTHLRMSHSGSLERGQDFFRAAMSVVEIAGARGAHAILNAGDMLNAPDNLPEVARQLSMIDQECQARKLPMYVVQGNHDFAEPSWIAVQENQPRADANDDVSGIHLLDGTIQVGGLKILGLPFMAPSELRQALAEAETHHVLVWHGAVLEFAKFPTDEIITCEDLTKGPWKAVLLGDIHVRQYLHCNDVVVGYPGATELCKKDEPLEHSCTIMDFDAKTGGVVGFEYAPVAHRPVITLTIADDVELAAAAVQVQERAKLTPALLVLATYADSVEGVRTRLQQAAGSRSIVRATAYSTESMQADTRRNEGETDKQPVDYLERFIPPGSDLHRLGQQLCDPDANVNELLRNYVGV